jgi:hypothetical protein
VTVIRVRQPEKRARVTRSRGHKGLQRFRHLPGRGARVILRLSRKRLRINEQPEIGDPSGFCLFSRRLGENVVNDDRCRYTLFFQPERVPHGAAGAGSSGADAYNHQVCPRLEVSNFTIGRGGREGVFLTEGRNALGVIKFGDEIFEVSPKLDGGNVAVEKKAEPSPLQLSNPNWAAKSFSVGPRHRVHHANRHL